MAQSIIVCTLSQLLPTHPQKACRRQQPRPLCPSSQLARKRAKSQVPDSASPASPTFISRATLILQRTMCPRIHLIGDCMGEIYIVVLYMYETLDKFYDAHILMDDMEIINDVSVREQQT